MSDYVVKFTRLPSSDEKHPYSKIYYSPQNNFNLHYLKMRAKRRLGFLNFVPIKDSSLPKGIAVLHVEESKERYEMQVITKKELKCSV